MVLSFNDFSLNETKKDITWYHGSDHTFTKFNNSFLKSQRSSVLGIFATDSKDFAEMFGENIYQVNVTYKNPKVFTHDKWYAIRGNKNTDYFLNLRNKLISEGYDSILIKESITNLGSIPVRNPNIVIVFDEKQIEIV